MLNQKTLLPEEVTVVTIQGTSVLMDMINRMASPRSLRRVAQVAAAAVTSLLLLKIVPVIFKGITGTGIDHMHLLQSQTKARR